MFEVCGDPFRDPNFKVLEGIPRFHVKFIWEGSGAGCVTHLHSQFLIILEKENWNN
jgi:hypothetical protein